MTAVPVTLTKMITRAGHYRNTVKHILEEKLDPNFESEIDSTNCVQARPRSQRAVGFGIYSGYHQIIFTSMMQLQFRDSGIIALSSISSRLYFVLSFLCTV